jgi:Zn-dependent protease
MHGWYHGWDERRCDSGMLQSLKIVAGAVCKAETHLNIFRSIHMGKLFNVDVNVHPTFGLVFVWAFLQWGLGSDGGLSPFVLGCLYVIAVFVSVLIHELGHCLMAQQFGIRVLDIALWPFGGVARIEQSPTDPRTELLIAVAGPAMNLAIFVALLPILLLVGVTLGVEELIPSGVFFGEMTLGSLVAYVAVTNLFLLGFNLLPAFPMDGGRVLRAALSPSLGRDRATSISVWIGTFLAALMIFGGIWQRSLILPVVGIFVVVAAQAEGRVVRVESAMKRLRVGQFALWDMGGISPDRPLTFALRGGPRDIVVTQNGYVMGMLWRSQLLVGLQSGMGDRTVSEIMDPNIDVVDVSESIYDVQQRMSGSNRWAIPVTEDGLYRGIFTGDRFVHLYRQIAPGILSRGVTIPQEWRDAIADNLKIRPRKR